MLGKKTNEGVIGGIYLPSAYLQLLKINYEDKFPWDDMFPGWRAEPVYLIFFEKPHRPLSDEQINEIFNIPLEIITDNDKLRDALSPPQYHMALPSQAVTWEGKGERVNDSTKG